MISEREARRFVEVNENGSESDGGESCGRVGNESVIESDGEGSCGNVEEMG